MVDVNYPLSQHTWLSNYAVRVPVDISDTTQVYKLYVNLRNTSDYSFSNIVLKLDIQGPDNTRELVEKTDIKLAYPDGEWKGSGAAAYYTHQVLVKEQYRFPVKGNYVIGIRHLMSASALKGISDVGLKIEPAG